MGAARLLFMSYDRPGVWSVPGLPVGDTTIVMATQGWFAWRLVGANNREIARSARTFLSFGACYAAADALRTRKGHFVDVVRHDDDRNQWAWHLRVDGIAEAASSRLYQRHRECLFNLEQFMTSIPDAVSAYDVVQPSSLDGQTVPSQRSASDRPGEHMTVGAPAAMPERFAV